MQRENAFCRQPFGEGGGGGADGRVAVTGTARKQFFIFLKKSLSHPDNSDGFTV